jgi:MoaA/NifB/PqqE/SkfB family radical SAM enzyme
MKRQIRSGLTIDVSGKCQGKCPYCSRTRLGNERFSGSDMSPQLFERILKHLLEIDILDRNALELISLFNRGEPLLNPDINRILRITASHGFQATLSSNFIAHPRIDEDCLPVIRLMTFSISGFSQETYGRIHGASLDRVLRNFEDFYSAVRQYSPKSMILISWHRYRFNEHELWNAFRYFNRPGIRFMPVVAYLNDSIEMSAFVHGSLSEQRLQQAQQDMFLSHVLRKITFHKSKSHQYQCLAWDTLTISEEGHLRTCCGFTSADSESLLGNVLDMSSEDIWRAKKAVTRCRRCIDSGICRWAYNLDTGGWGDMPFPDGGGIDHAKLWLARTISVENTLMALRNHPSGMRALSFAKRMVKTFKT